MYIHTYFYFICVDNLSITSISKRDESNRLREVDECQEDRSQKVSVYCSAMNYNNKKYFLKINYFTLLVKSNCNKTKKTDS